MPAEMVQTVPVPRGARRTLTPEKPKLAFRFFGRCGMPADEAQTAPVPRGARRTLTPLLWDAGGNGAAGLLLWRASVETAIRNTLAAACRWGAASADSCCAVPTCAARTGRPAVCCGSRGAAFLPNGRCPDVSGAALLPTVGTPYAYRAFSGGDAARCFSGGGNGCRADAARSSFDFKRSSKRKYRLIYGRAARAARSKQNREQKPVRIAVRQRRLF